MKAFIKTRYGGPEILQFADVATPTVKDEEVLIKVMANSANPADWHILRGKPLFARFTTGVFKPSNPILGADFSGIVEAVGKKVTNFSLGDRVFGEALTGGAFAEYIAVPADNCALMPEGHDFPEMAAVPIAGLTALQAMVTHGKLQAGESLLVNGSAGGVGHFTVQIAKALGAQVTAVCSEKNRSFVQALGADRVIAYDKENIHQHKGKYNLVIDTHGNLRYQDYTRMGERGVMVGFTTMGNMIRLLLRRALGTFPIAQFTAACNAKDLETLATLIQNKSIRVHKEREYSYKEIPQAIAYIEGMHTRGKVVMNWQKYYEE